MSHSQIEELIVRYLQNDLTDEESQLLEDWKAGNDKNLVFFNQITDKALLLKKLDFYSKNNLEKELAKAHAQLFPPELTNVPAVHRIHFLRTAWFRYAAALIVVMGTAIYFYTSYYTQTQKLAWIKNKASDIAPGSYRAELILADGTTIILDSTTQGAIAHQGNASIEKTSEGQIVYNSKGLSSGQLMMNSMRTPRGGKYRLKLPDGTTVWLNAESSIEFPAAFNGKVRNVKVSGEVYFDVVKNKQQPFTVSTDGGPEVEVLGTAFNVNAYKDESAIRITLMDGSVKISGDKKSTTLKPGQQALLLQGSSQSIEVRTVNTEQVTAWMNGVFNVDQLKLREVLRMLARWYDLDIVVPENVADVVFVGEIKQNLQLSQVLNILSKMEINFRLENRKLIVLPDSKTN